MNYSINNYLHNNLVVAQNSEAANIFVVIDGTFEISFATKYKDKSSFEKKVINDLVSNRSSRSSKFTSYKDFKIQHQVSDLRIKVALANKGQIMGHSDAIKGKQNSFTIKCISQRGSLYVCKADEFKTHMSKIDEIWQDLLRSVDEIDRIY